MKHRLATATITIALTAAATFAFAHCQIPCGIYGDAEKFSELRQDIDTVEKAIKQVNELSAADSKNGNQLVRWVTNKDAHAQKIQQTALDYFLAQRIKAGQPQYEKRLELLHTLIVQAMKCKQTTDVEHVEALRKALDEFEAIYFGKEEKKHVEEDHSGHDHSGHDHK